MMKILHAFSFIFLMSLVLSGCVTQQTTTSPKAQPQPREPVIALALGGGGAKGFAHIGVIKVLESHGIKPKIVTGTSAGSFVGSIYASGKTPFEMQQIALTLKESDLRDLTLSSKGILVGQKLQNYINTTIHNQPIEQLPIRFAAVATRLDTGNKAEFIQGNTGLAVRASCSIPNIFIPTKIGKFEYVDGGLTSPIPVKTAQAMGADIIIAVDISARPKAIPATGVWGLLDQTLNIMGQQNIQEELKYANVIIQPKIDNLGVLDLSNANAAIIEGEKAAQLQIKSINQAIRSFKASPAALQPPRKPKF